MKINIQNACKKKNVPTKNQFIKWLKKIFKNNNIELTIRLVTIKEIQFLNNYFRKKNVPTNVLTFPTKNFWKKKIIKKYT